MINYLLQGGSFDGYLGTLHRREAPYDLRIVSRNQLKDETIVCEVYHLLRVDPMPIKSLGMSSTYRYQGSRPTAASLIDITI